MHRLAQRHVLDSTEERATEACFFDFQDMAPSPRRNTYAPVDLRSSGSPPQSESAYPATSATNLEV